MRGEWTETSDPAQIPGWRRAGSEIGQFGCACLGVMLLVLLACSFVYFLFGMTTVAYNAWDIVAHWLLVR